MGIKTTKRLIALVLVCLIVCGLTACSTTLKGTYTSKGLIKQSFTFKDDHKVEVSAFGLTGIEGSYEIKDGKITITYTLAGVSLDLEKSFEKDGDSIFIDGTEFIKE